jgi:chorismate synthase
MFTARLRFLTAGESHGPNLTGILDGMPAGLAMNAALIDRDLARRQRGFGAGGRMQLEQDRATITAGVMNHLTTGGPIALTIANLDHRNWRDRDIAPMTAPRPGHADLTGAVKYGHRDLRLALERASARETAMRVAVGAICRALVAEFGIAIGGYVTRIGDVSGPFHEPPADPDEFQRRFAAAEQNDVRCPDAEVASHMRAAIEDVIRDRDTLGGAIEVAALRVPAGLGSFVQSDRRLDARLAAALMGLPAVKAVEIGGGTAASLRRGTLAQDAIELAGDRLVRSTNWAGGVEGGISNGMPLVARIALKPIATTLAPQRTVDLATGKPAPTKYERSDFCQVPRAVAIAEATLAIIIADALLEKLGGDSLAEMMPRFHALRQLRLPELPMDAVPWRFGYGG